uniref:Uncharacterized protein n=1 Tax=Beet leafhopper transmitted virescence phytoplasma TaxID=37694 RepID=Q6JKN2_9MOLU|nr:hypothetical protein [Beet leafhopper transmitted virescence phytoplasma]AAR84208.1 unknown [Beet leafhopper transmitted virescence phytoplasma]
MLPDSKNKNFYFLVLILLLIIAIMAAYNFLYLKKIDENKDIKVIDEVTEVKEIEKKVPISCIKCDGEKSKETQENIVNIKGNIQEINGVKHHHYIVPDSEFDDEGIITNACNQLFKFFGGWKPTLMHSFIKKLNPNYNGWIGDFPSFNENIDKPIGTQIKYPPMDLVGIYFDKGTRFISDKGVESWNTYTFDEVVKATNGAENVYYFWRTPNMFNKFFKNKFKHQEYKRVKIDPNDPHLNHPHCPLFAKVLTQEDIDNL